MKPNEVLERLHYLDTRLTKICRITAEEIPFPVFEDHYYRVRSQAEQLPIEVIRKELVQMYAEINEPWWAELYKNLLCKVMIANTALCCVDGEHHMVDSIPTSRGMLLSTLMEQGKQDPKAVRRIGRCLEKFDFLITKLPIVVDPYGYLTEVMLGNHRMMAAMAKNLTRIRVLCITKEKENVCSHFDLSQQP